MKILRLISTVDRADGGPTEGLFQSTKVLIEAGHEVTIVSLDDPRSVAIRDAPIEVTGIGAGLEKDVGKKFAYCANLMPWLRSHIREYDAVVLHGMWQYLGICTHRAAREARIPYFVFTHGNLDPWFKRTYPLKHLKKYIYWLAFEYRVLRDARGVLFTAQAECELARHSFRPYRVRERVVRYGTSGMPPEFFAVGQGAFKAALPALKSNPYLLFLGRIHPKKGCDILVRAFAAISAEYPELQLVMAGPDQVGWQSDLEEMCGKLGVADRVHWVGMLQGQMKWEAFKNALAFVLPSHSENFGIVIAEALSCGCPVLTTRGVNIWQEILDAEAGLISSDSLGDTVNMLRHYLDLPPERRFEMRSNARDCFEKNFHIGRAVETLIGTISSEINDDESVCLQNS